MSDKTVKNFFHGTATLIGAALTVKIIGALLKIPLLALIKEDGMGYFSVAFELFKPIYAIATAGLPIAVSKTVSSYTALGRSNETLCVKKTALCLFILIGLVGTIFMASFAQTFCVHFAKVPDAVFCVILMAPAVFFCCITSALRGYFEGLGNMKPTALSQITEAVFKLIFGLGFAYVTVIVLSREYRLHSTVWGQIYQSDSEAMKRIYCYSASAAILGVMLSTAAATLAIVIYNISQRDSTKIKTKFNGSIAKELISIAIPVSLGALAVNITSLVDLSSVTNRLAYAVNADPDTVVAMYNGLTASGRTIGEIPNFIFGAYQGMSVTLFNVAPTIATAIAVGTLPMIASSWAVHNHRQTENNINTVLRITSAAAFPIGCGMSVMSKPVLALLFSKNPIGVEIATVPLTILGVAVIFVSVMTTVNSILQAIGKSHVPVKLMVIGGIIKIAVNYTFVSIPEINIKGAPIGTLVCYAVMVIAGLLIVKKTAQCRLDLRGIVLKPLFASLLTSICAVTCHSLLCYIMTSRMSTILSVAISAVFYVVFACCIRIIEKNEIKLLPMGEKLIKVLEKANKMS